MWASAQVDGRLCRLRRQSLAREPPGGHGGTGEAPAESEGLSFALRPPDGVGPGDATRAGAGLVCEKFQRCPQREKLCDNTTLEVRPCEEVLLLVRPAYEAVSERHAI